MSKNHSYIISDHLRSAVFIISDGVDPAPKGAGYILRRLIRRAFSSALFLNIDINNAQFYKDFIQATINIYQSTYPEIQANQDHFVAVLLGEAQKYSKAVEKGEKEWRKVFAKNPEIKNNELVEKAWDLYQTSGVPFEVSETEVAKFGKEIDLEKLESLIQEHQSKSKEAGKIQFTSGLVGDSQKTRKLHTATHILHHILRERFGDEVHQVGSAITDEKARFDITLPQALTPEEMQNIENKINQIISLKLPMVKQEMSPEEARKLGAVGLFGEKYGEIVSVYTIADETGKVYSREFCGGPHAENTADLGSFYFIKQKSIGAGKRRLEYNLK